MEWDLLEYFGREYGHLTTQIIEGQVSGKLNKVYVILTPNIEIQYGKKTIGWSDYIKLSCVKLAKEAGISPERLLLLSLPNSNSNQKPIIRFNLMFN